MRAFLEKTITQYLLERKNSTSQKAAVKYKQKGHWQELTWAQYYEKIEFLSCAMMAWGISKGDHVAIYSNSRFEWSAWDWACLAIGAVPVPIYQSSTVEDLLHILKMTEPKFLIVEGRNQYQHYLAVKEQGVLISQVSCIETSASADLELINFEEALLFGRKNHAKFKDQVRDLCQSHTLEDTATLFFTSGTTGLPKGVVLTHQQIISEVGDAFPLVGASDKDTTLSFLPYAHVMGRIETWGNVFSGYTLAFAESIEALKKNLQEVKPTILIAVPRIFEKIYTQIQVQLTSDPLKAKLFNWSLDKSMSVLRKVRNHEEPSWLEFAEHLVSQQTVLKKIKELFGGRLRFCVSGGAPLSNEISEFFGACGVQILEGYGLTETTAAIFVNTPHDAMPGTVGRPLGDVLLKFGNDGEILVKSKKIMKEYYKDPESTRNAFTEDGFFKTGDIGEILPTGHLKITDRKKDLIKTAGGKYVAPQKLESLLKNTGVISHAVVHGDQRKYIVVLLTLELQFLKDQAQKQNLSGDIHEVSQSRQVLEFTRKLISQVNSQLASYESIKRFLILPTEFTVENGELTPSLKVKRKFLEKKFKDEIESLYLS